MKYASKLLGPLGLALTTLAISPALAQTTSSIAGKVTGPDGAGMPGVTVVVKGTNQGTSTDGDGAFRLENVSPTAVLVFSSIGSKPQEMPVNGRTQLSVALQDDSQALDEVVVVGYGTQRKSHLTGAVAKVTNENLQQIPVARPDQALIGKLAGVQISTSNAQAGSAPTIQVRGAASVTAGTSPLIVVDGYPVPTDLSAIDMNDVESIEVLKDAASAAIYGSRGANGVILVTTKSGKSGKTKVTFNTYFGGKETVKRLPLYNLDDWASYVRGQNNDVLSPEIQQAQRINAGTDAQDAVFRRGYMQSYQANVQGGGEAARFFISGSYLKDQGVVINNDYTKYNVRANVDFKLSERFEAGVSLNPSYTKQNELAVSLHDAIRSIPAWMPIYTTEATAALTGKPVGSYQHQRDFDPARNPFYKATGLTGISTSGDNNGIAQIEGQPQSNTELRTITNAYVKVKILPGLTLRSSLGFFTRSYERDYFQASFAKTDAFTQGDAMARAATRAIVNTRQVLDVLNENIFNYQREIGQHTFDAVAGYTVQGTEYSNTDGTAVNFATDNIRTLNAGTVSAVSSSKEQNRLQSALFRVNYAFRDTYLLSLGSRWDGSSRFGADNRWGFFPSASLGVRISEMPFLKGNETLSELKLRASFGATGNNNIGNYSSRALVSPAGAILGSSEGVVPGFNVSSYGNRDLGWERTFSLNTGIDIGVFQNRVRLAVDAYQSTTDRLLLNVPLSSVTGFDSYLANQGKIQNRGIEFELTTRIMEAGKLKWDLSAVGTRVRNELVNLGGTERLVSTGDPKRNNFFLAQVGQPLVQYYGYKFDREVPITGSNYWPIGVASERVFVKDLNGDGKIDSNDRTVLGSPYPKFTWGLTNTLRYGPVDLSFVLQGSHGAKIFNIDPHYYEGQFTATGSSAYLALPAAEQAFTRIKSETDYEVQDASYVALRNLNIGYAVPVSFSKKAGMSSLRVYMTAANLFYSMAKDYTSLNPEGVSADFSADPLRQGWQKGAYPIARTVAFGINAEF
ncbi:SusC/RagA family TonB-linked outer membrane protein [Hymenobacter psychrophilus]|uniref:TonB-linked outer membrane protein, SusC/RagA family n=1 Tax=Hymenobacter psychrophilus TaxID=651662 RepID=A0A1H3L9H1_9BACT|nr:TonB-dependent receptor [Hymenobacter psychrophilus]SDY61082.1 TonB-linked outer membrane protein, SusC/RagA family [Hymenobacter psychrophilus]